VIKNKGQLKVNIEQIGFQIALELARISADLMVSCRLFHTVGPATEKARSPNLVLAVEQ